MVDMPCDRCGKCCYMYNARGHQIHFQPDAPFFQLSQQEQYNLHSLVPIYLHVKDDFKKKKNDNLRYFIPTKAQIQSYLTPSQHMMIPLTDTNGSECMFLQWTTNSLAKCVIHAYNPKMCREYPENKGGACLNHVERRYTEKFLTYQHQQIGFAVKILRELHRNKITDPLAWEIVTFLMDFGRFPLQKVRNFFVVFFKITSQHFDHIVHLLEKFTLVRVIEQTWIEGIALKEVEQVIDTIMAEKGWKFPQ